MERNGQVLRDEVETLAELLHDHGWATSAVVASFPVAAKFGFGQGFDAFDDRFSESPRRDRPAWEGHPAPDSFYSLSGLITVRALGELDRLHAEGRGPAVPLVPLLRRPRAVWRHGQR